MTDRLSFYDLSTKGAASENEHLLGHEAWFEDTDATQTGTGARKKLSGMKVQAIWVKNETGSTLSPGHLVQWGDASTAGELTAPKAVDTLSGDDEQVSGVVSDHISGTVADDDHFWMIVRGPCRIRMQASENITITEGICSAASGLGRAYVNGTDDVNSEIGFALEADTSTTSGQLVRAIVDIPLRSVVSH